MTLAAVILAGGASTRMGSPKALLEYRGETFLDRLIGLMGAHCSPVIVVLGHQPETIRAGLSRAGAAVIVHNPNYSEGQLSSLQCGLSAVPAGADGFMFTLVDHPAVEDGTIERIAEQAAGLTAPWLVIPRYHGRRGHPVCCSRDLIAEFLTLPRGSQAREVVHRHLEHTCYVEVEDSGILKDVDDPEAYRRLSGLE